MHSTENEHNISYEFQFIIILTLDVPSSYMQDPYKELKFSTKYTTYGNFDKYYGVVICTELKTWDLTIQMGPSILTNVPH